MISRCHDSSSHSFKRYGAEGIRVCEAWKNSYSAFITDVGKRPSRLHSIDRIDNDGDYTPENVKWSLPKEQQLNRRDTIMFSINGESAPMQTWAAKYNVDPDLIRHRLRRGWSPKEALFIPKNVTRGHHNMPKIPVNSTGNQLRWYRLITEYQRRVVLEVLDNSEGVINEAAALLELQPVMLQAIIKRLDIRQEVDQIREKHSLTRKKRRAEERNQARRDLRIQLEGVPPHG